VSLSGEILINWTHSPLPKLTSSLPQSSVLLSPSVSCPVSLSFLQAPVFLNVGDLFSISSFFLSFSILFSLLILFLSQFCPDL
jgi:hypothetical protein